MSATALKKTELLAQYSTTFLAHLRLFALDYRQWGRYGCDRAGSLSQLLATAAATGIALHGSEDACRVCRELAAVGCAAFEV